MYVYPLVTCTILLTTLLMFILTKRQKGDFRSFIYLSVCTLWWHGSWVALFRVQSEDMAHLISRIGHVGILYLPIAYRNLYADLVGTARSNRSLHGVYVAFLVLLLFTDTVIDGVNKFSWGYYPKAGVLHPLFIALVSFVVLESVFKCVRLVMNNRDNGKRASLLVATAACVIFSAGSVDFLLNYNITALTEFPVGFVATIVFVVMNAVGIAKYHLYQQEFLVLDLRQRNDGLQDDLDLKTNLLAESEKLLAKISRQNEDLKLRDQTISAFLPPSVRRELSAGMNPLEYHPKKLKHAVIFVDLRDYTAIAEQSEIEEVYVLINKYFDLVNKSVYANGGEVNKYMGDGALGLFLDPKDCVSAIVDFLQALEEFNSSRRNLSRNEIRIGIGVSYGEVLSGNFGSEWKVERSVIGDVVNIASRLEQLTKDYGCQVIADYEFVRQLDKSALTRPIGIETLKGKSVPIRLYEIFEHGSQKEIDLKLKSRPVLELLVEKLTAGEWSEAMELLESMDKHQRTWDKPLQGLHRFLSNILRRDNNRDKETA